MNTYLSTDELRRLLREELSKIAFVQSNESKLLSRKQAAEILGVQEQTLAVWAMDGKGPAPTKIGTRSMYRHSILQEFIEENTMSR